MTLAIDIPRLPARKAGKTHCVKGHELTPDNLVEKKLPHRWCLKCYLQRCERFEASRNAYFADLNDYGNDGNYAY